MGDLQLEQEKVNDEFKSLEEEANKIAQSSARKKSIKELADSAKTKTPQQKEKFAKRLDQLTAKMEKLREIKQPVTEAENRLRENRLRENRLRVLEKRQINRSSA